MATKKDKNPSVSSLQTKNWKLNDINPAAYNPRSIGEAELQGLVESIKKFGLVQPFIVNIRGGKNVLVGGHQRLKALEVLGEKEGPVIEVDLDPVQEKALNVALNNPSIQGEFTNSIKDILGELETYFPAEDFYALRLNHVPVPIVKDDWDSDHSDVDDVDEDDSPVPGKIKITCSMVIREELMAKIQDLVSESGYTDVEIE